MAHPLDHPLLPIWLGLISRCHSPSHPAYRHYGGRGIAVCRRWMSFPNFVKDMGERPSPTHSVERNNVNQGYSPTNCRWATQTEQARNTRRTVWLTHNGERRSLPEWAERVGISPITLSKRIKLGWPIDVALTRRPNRGKRVVARRTNELCAAAGITRSTFYARLRLGWSEHDALHTPIARQLRGGIKAKCDAVGISISTFYSRVKQGWSEEQALQTPSRTRKSQKALSAQLLDLEAVIRPHEQGAD